MSRILLAPMEGLADYVLRDVLTGIGGFDSAVSEFVRVSASVLPRRTYERICPELMNGCHTPVGTPMVIQLLGSDPDWLALNAEQASVFSPHGVDLNFGCPAKTVNRHGGGAMLLADPELLSRIVRAVRASVPTSIPVTAKMRLGVSDTSRAIDCAQALVEGGAASLVVHARTKDDGYRPPAHWEWIAKIADAVNVPVTANGEVWTVDDWRRCRSVSGCNDVMIGRGAVADPYLALRIKGLMDEKPSAEDWSALIPRIAEYWEKVHTRVLACHAPGRLKLLLSYFRRTWPEAVGLYDAVRTIRDPLEISKVLQAAQSQ
ncbi:MAG: tRNA-dihydrouridine synthase [Gammaproteobacteria bacterium]|nr:tRNA-dihydrouridine synthase [Gammaproteobacteria bacterium]MBU1601681.1 tRNA-dihydrouridine synthase [Gammaproteobacteria bacterium]MBU2434760.1 tRNA-dihydrouridine synthase [Gammaproteobacteria bacterium]MBU2448001.1 tRNA-dihydrouridine synthase [Gammaproteobacteria bacterium]